MSSDPDQLDTKINFGSSAFKKYFFNTSWLFAERIFRLLVTFLVGIFIMRYLGPDQFGLLSYALSFVGLFYAFSTLGLDSIVVRELIKLPDRQNEIMGTVFYLRLAGSFISIILILTAVLIIGESTSILILILIISTTTIFQSLYIIDYYFQSKVLAKYSAIVQFSSLVISSIIKLALIYLDAGLIYFAAVTAFEFFIIGINFLIVYKITGSKVSAWKFDKGLSVNLLKDAWPLMLSVLAITIYMKIDQVMIKNMLDERQVGFYAAAVRLTEAWYFIPIAIVTSLFPAILNAKKLDERIYLNRLQKLYDLLVFIAVVIALPVTFLSEQIIMVLLGNDFLSSASVLTVYIWGSVAVFLGIASNQYLITENYTKISFYRTLIGVVLNIILNLLLIPLMGIIGSALATLISYTLSIFSIYLFKNTSHQSGMMIKALLLVDIFKLIYKKLVKVN